MWKLNFSLLNGDEEQEEDILGEESEGICTSLSPLQRIYGFGGSLLAGLIFMLLSLIVFARPIKFALMFTIGNVLAVGSTAFLIGPGKQLSMMFDPVRLYATAIYIGSVVLALIFALLIHNKILTLLAVITEICALICCSFASQRNSSYDESRTDFTNLPPRLSDKYLGSLQLSGSAGFGYGLSYIPFARRMVAQLMVRFCDTEI